MATLANKEKNKDHDNKEWLILLLLLLLSFVCVFCASQSALYSIVTNQIPGNNMRSQNEADYGPGISMAIPPLYRDRIIAELVNDEEALIASSLGTIGSVPVAVSILPQSTALPVPTPRPPLPTPSPQPTFTATPAPSEATNVGDDPTSVPTSSEPQPQTSPTVSAPPTVAPASPTVPALPTASPPPLPSPTLSVPTSTASPVVPPTPLPTSPPPTAIPNIPPTANDDTATTAEDVAVVIDVLSNDTDSDGLLVPSTVSLVSGPTNGSVSINSSNGQITYTPNPDFNGSDSFSYQVCDNDGACDTATVTITVTPVNDPPVAVDDTATTFQETAVAIDVPANDSDPEGNLDLTSVTIISGPSNGTGSVNPVTGVITYTPAVGFVGLDTFTYVIFDTDLPILSATATVTITVLPIVYFNSVTYSVDEDKGPAVITVTLSAASAVTAMVDYATSGGTATAGSDYTVTNGTLTFLPGQQILTFTIPISDDILANEFTETVSLTLSNAVNATLGITNSATLSIIDNDTVSVQFGKTQYSVNEGNDAGTGLVTATILITLTNPSATPITVDYATVTGGTATAGVDYNSSSGTLTFLPLQTHQSFFVGVISDTTLLPASELDETIALTISNSVSATLGAPNTATLTIIEDDPPGSCPGGSTAPNVGSPDGVTVTIACGEGVVMNLGTPITADGNNDADLVYYGGISGVTILLDQVIVQIGSSSSGPWHTVFYWGDDILNENTNIGSSVPLPESNNKTILTTLLYGTPPLQSGITIDVDARVPAGSYSYVRIYAPYGPADGVEVDAIEILP